MDTLELQSGLINFYGTENYYANPFYQWMRYTDGVKFFFENAGGGAYWFSDIIGTEMKKLTATEEFIVIELKSDGKSADIIGTDGNENEVYRRKIEFTDCPAGKWKFFLTDNVLMLASEY